jgi:pyruvate,orthophosphate dikinase
MNVTTATKWVYAFGAGRNEGRAGMRNLLGGKGANLAEMAAIGLPVPPGFTITTEVCTAFYANDRKYPAGLEPQVREALAGVEAATGAASAIPRTLCSSPSGRARASRCLE